MVIVNDEMKSMTNNKPRHISVFIADDHHLFVDALAIALESQSTISVSILETASNGEDLLLKLQAKLPDILLLDLNMPILNGMDVIPILKADYPSLKIVVVTKYSDPKFVRECLHEQSIAGYFLKTSRLEELIEALDQVHQGHSYISKGLQLYPKETEEEEVSAFDERFLSKYNLTRREIEILGLIALAKSNAEIADGLFISPQTVSAHRKNIMRKLNISSTAGLVRFAIENQLG